MRRLVLVHGLGVSPRYFTPLREELSRDYDVAAPDLRGGGGFDGMVRALAEVVAPGEWLLGNSMGCQLIAELAVREPAAVGGAIFVGPTVDRRARTWLEQGRRLLIDALREPPSLLRIIVSDYVRTGPLRTARMARDALRDPVELKVDRLEPPLLIVRGERDPLCPQRWAAELATRAPLGRLQIVAGAAHAAHYSHPRELGALVRAFVQEPE